MSALSSQSNGKRCASDVSENENRETESKRRKLTVTFADNVIQEKISINDNEQKAARRSLRKENERLKIRIRKLEEALHSAESRLRTLKDSGRQAILVLNRQLDMLIESTEVLRNLFSGDQDKRGEYLLQINEIDPRFEVLKMLKASGECCCCRSISDSGVEQQLSDNELKENGTELQEKEEEKK